MRAIAYRQDCDERYVAIKEHMGDVKGKTMLDIGCANGYFCSRFLEDGGAKAVGVDTDPTCVRECAQLELTNFEVFRHILEVRDNFDFCLFLDLQFHENLDYIDFCRAHGKTCFISPSGDGARTNDRLRAVLDKAFKSVVPVIMTTYANRMTYKCE